MPLGLLHTQTTQSLAKTDWRSGWWRNTLWEDADFFRGYENCKRTWKIYNSTAHYKFGLFTLKFYLWDLVIEDMEKFGSPNVMWHARSRTIMTMSWMNIDVDLRDARAGWERQWNLLKVMTFRERTFTIKRNLQVSRRDAQGKTIFVPWTTPSWRRKYVLWLLKALRADWALRNEGHAAMRILEEFRMDAMETILDSILKYIENKL